MNQFFVLQSGLLRALGMSMIHSMWQGALVFLPVLLLLSLIPKEKAVWRYRVLYGGLMAMLFVFVFTFLKIYLASVPGPGGTAMELTGPSLLPASGNYPAPSGTGSLAGRMTTWLHAFEAPLASMLALVWIAGFLVTGTRLVTGIYASRSFVRRRTFDPGHKLSETFEKVCQLLDVTVKVRLRMSAKKISPMVTGILKPVIVVPIAAMANLSPTQVEAILAHELAHIRRHDHLFLLLQEMAKGILFFHPLTWYLTRGINREREHCCDDLVMKTYTDPINYIKALTMVQEMNLSGIHAANAATGKPARLLSRIRRLVRPQIPSSPLPRLVAVLALMLCAGLLLGSTLRKPDHEGPSASLSALTETGTQPDDSSRVEVLISIDNEDAWQDTSIFVMTKRVDLSGRPAGYEVKEITVRMSNDSVREITVNGKPVPSGEYYLYADTIASLRTGLKARQRIIITDNDSSEIRKEIEIIINGTPSRATYRELDSLLRDLDTRQDNNIEIIIHDAESSTFDGPVMGDLLAGLYPDGEIFTPYLQQLRTLQADSAYYNKQLQLFQTYNNFQPDTGRNLEYLQQYLEQLKKTQEEARLTQEEMKQVQEEAAGRAADMAREYFDQLKKAQEQANLSQKDMNQAQKEAAERAADMAREQAARAKELSEQAMERMLRAKADMEAAKAEQEDARQKMQEEMRQLQEEMKQKQMEMQELFQELQQQGDSLFIYIPPTGEPYYLALPDLGPPTAEPYPYYFVPPEGTPGDESTADPDRTEELNSTLRDLEK